MVELLAPAGDIDSFNAALKAGADAVYMAGKAFGARASATNFTSEEYVECLKKAHLNNKKIYLTLNTLIKEKEWKDLYDFLNPLYTEGLDGVIFQDMGLIEYLKDSFPELPLHASTQMTVTDSNSAEILRSKGVCRIVPARELSLKELKYIKDRTGLEIETFIHGALCYSYSGQCLFSSFLGGRSGNRGRCAGPCRLPYSVYESANNKALCNNRYPLSLKDLCTLEHVSELIEAGIDSFKIEGRLKSPEYVWGVTHTYRKYIDRYYEGKDTTAAKEDMDILSSLYLRSSVGSGYYFKHNGKEMISLNDPSYNNKDEGLIRDIKRKLDEECPGPSLNMKGVFRDNREMELTVSDGSFSYTTRGDLVQSAKGRPASREDVAKQLSKLGGSGFSLNELDIELDDNVFLPVSRLNDLRREALKGLKDRILESYRRSDGIRKELSFEYYPLQQGKDYSISVSSVSQYYLALKRRPAIIYLPYDLIYSGEIAWEEIHESLKDSGTELFLSLPRIMRYDDETYMETFLKDVKEHLPAGILVKNMEELGFLLNHDIDLVIHADHSIYCWNRSALKYLKGFVDRITAALELSMRELCDLDNRDMVIPIYGRSPLMVSAGCIAKTFDKCDKKTGKAFILRDRYNKEHIDLSNCIHCYNEIYNAVPTSLHKQIESLLEAGFGHFRIDLTVETDDEVRNILDYYMSGEVMEYPVKEYTGGHIVKGAI